jgi:putative ABC transport system permease protein
VNGVDAAELAARPRGPERWTLRREYRNTWRDTLTAAEAVVEGRWWGPADRPLGSGRPSETAEADGQVIRHRVGRISVEADLARDLEVGLGDRITWDVGGRSVETIITSLRTVDWQRFEPNFFVVFEPGVLESAPRTSVLVTRVEDPSERAELQTRLVRAYPNVSSVDLTRVQEAIGRVLERVNQALRFLGLFTAAAGVIVLAGALGTSRYQRMRESALLRTLGARRGQVRMVLLAEYLALGTLASVTGMVLAVAAAAALSREVFEVAYLPDLRSLAALWTGVTALTVFVGITGSGGLLRRPPLPVLRRASE